MSIHYLLEQFFAWILSYPPNIVLFTVLAILFIGSILESIPFAGIFFPMETVTVAIGVLAFKGIVDIKILIGVAFLGLFIGDEVGYQIGKKLGSDFIKKHAKKLRVDEQRYTTLSNSLDNNFLKILFIARSNGFTRWLVPFIAGANAIDYKRFMFSNFITAIFWANVFLLGGYYLGNAFELYGKYFGIGIIIATVVSFIAYKTYKYFDKKQWLRRDDFKLLLINILGIYLFSKMIEDILDLEIIVKLDFWIHTHIVEIYSPLLTSSMVSITTIFNTIPLIIVTTIISIYFLYKKYYKDVVFLSISMIGSSILFAFIKGLVQRERPNLQIIEVFNYSFPSGHATMTTTLAFALFWILKDKIKFSKILLLSCVSIVLIVSFSRVYLNVHYLSDVIGGIGLGLFWVSLVALIFDIISKKKMERK